MRALHDDGNRHVVKPGMARIERAFSGDAHFGMVEMVAGATTARTLPRGANHRADAIPGVLRHTNPHPERTGLIQGHGKPRQTLEYARELGELARLGKLTEQQALRIP